MHNPLKPYLLVITLLVLVSSSSCVSPLPAEASLVHAVAFSGVEMVKSLHAFNDIHSPNPAAVTVLEEEIESDLDPETSSTFPLLKPIDPTISYITRSGDTLASLAARFAVSPDQILGDQSLDDRGLLPAGILLRIPRVFDAETTPYRLLIPDSEAIFSASAEDFDAQAYVQGAGGLLSNYKAFVPYYKDAEGWEIVQHIAKNYSVNPRLLLTLLEYNGQWVNGYPQTPNQELYPLGYYDGNYEHLTKQLIYAAQQLSVGYYGWRDGTLTALTFKDGSQLKLHPSLNAGTVAVMHFFTKVYTRDGWEAAMAPQAGFSALYTRMFGDPWTRAAQYPLIFPSPSVTQPEMVLPFEGDDLWFFASGPHGAWVDQGAQAAIDFTPSTDKLRCVPADNWVLAPVTGLVTRLSSGLMVLDLDMDGSEQTGWALLILHLEAEESIQLGDIVYQDQRIGHASCLGGRSTDSHIHLARKYNGEWIHAGGPIPFVLSGWEVISTGSTYEGFLTNGTTTLRASITGTVDTQIRREEAVSVIP